MFARPRPAPFAVSALTHGILLGWLAAGPVLEKPPSLYRQAIAPHTSKLVWYNFREKLPAVAPSAAKPDPKPPRAEIKLPSQEIVAGAAHAPRAQQFIWQPAPNIELRQDLKSPNVLAVHAAAPAPPPLPPKPFIPPTPKQAAAPRAALEAPPELRLARNLNAAGAVGNVLGVRPARPEPRAFVAPQAGQGGTTATPALPAPPTVEAVAPERRIYFPPAAHAVPGAPVPVLSEAPALAASAPTFPVSLAIVSLHPSASATVPLPAGARNGQFSAGPNLRAGGAGGAEGATLVVPGLMIRKGAPDATPALVARASPTSAPNLRAALHANLPRASASAAALPHPAAIRVSSSPDPMLDGRAIYAMTVQMPNITSYSGSWLIWFAERQPVAGANAAVRAPVPLRKVDPKYMPSAIADGVEGKVRLAAVIRGDGRVESVRLLQHVDDRLDRSAAEAINKWEFEPALRNGQPVDVDAVIEIPFRLAPKVTP